MILMWTLKSKEINYIYILQFRHLAGSVTQRDLE